MRFFHIKKYVLSFGILLFLGSCAEKNVTIIDETFEDEVIQEPDLVEQRTVTGSFRSVSGVMNELSCYCSNGGYVTTVDGEEVAVCFNEPVESCDKITVTGYKTSKKIESNGSCPGGIMSFLKVQSYVIGNIDY